MFCFFLPCVSGQNFPFPYQCIDDIEMGRFVEWLGLGWVHDVKCHVMSGQVKTHRGKLYRDLCRAGDRNKQIRAKQRSRGKGSEGRDGDGGCW
jgi:hypothetical protein